MGGLALPNHGHLLKTSLRWIGALDLHTPGLPAADRLPARNRPGHRTRRSAAALQPAVKKTLVIGGGRDHLSESDFGENFSDAEISDLLGRASSARTP